MNEPIPSTVLLTAWHLPVMCGRSLVMPRLFWRIRWLERRTERQPECLWMHRWMSRRSLLLTSHWASPGAAERWLASAEFEEVDRTARGWGATTRVERLRPADRVS